MSQTVIFGVGIVVFALTVWGAVMAGGIWLGALAESNEGAWDPIGVERSNAAAHDQRVSGSASTSTEHVS